jgi:hypothetical protein
MGYRGHLGDALSVSAHRPSVTPSGAPREPAPVDRIATDRAPSTGTVRLGRLLRDAQRRSRHGVNDVLAFALVAGRRGGLPGVSSWRQRRLPAQARRNKLPARSAPSGLPHATAGPVAECGNHDMLLVSLWHYWLFLVLPPGLGRARRLARRAACDRPASWRRSWRCSTCRDSASGAGSRCARGGLAAWRPPPRGADAAERPEHRPAPPDDGTDWRTTLRSRTRPPRRNRRNAPHTLQPRLGTGRYQLTPLPQPHTRGGNSISVTVRAGRATWTLVRFQGFPQMV